MTEPRSQAITQNQLDRTEPRSQTITEIHKSKYGAVVTTNLAIAMAMALWSQLT